VKLKEPPESTNLQQW